jgi:hypothetical protein
MNVTRYTPKSLFYLLPIHILFPLLEVLKYFLPHASNSLAEHKINEAPAIMAIIDHIKCGIKVFPNLTTPSYIPILMAARVNVGYSANSEERVNGHTK